MKKALAAGILLSLVVGLAAMLRKELFVLKIQPLDVLKTSFRIIDQFPDPAQINNAGKWYFLNHVSSNLIEYDHENASFLPLIAKSWEIKGSTYLLKVDPVAKFSDGSPIRARDVVASLKRIIAKRTSPHFPLWQHVVDCENVRTLLDPCPGISGDDQTGVVEVQLKTKSTSFLLQISSPESGIWSEGDIDPKTLEIKPTKFSGPYAMESLIVNKNRELILLRNPFSKIQTSFPDSPREIRVKSMMRNEVEASIERGETDVFIGDFIPFNDRDWETMDVGLHFTTPSSIIYFFKLNSERHIGRDLLVALSEVPDKRLTYADTILPITPSIALTKAEFAELLPERSSRHLVVAAPGFYYKDRFLEFVKARAKSAGIDLTIVKVDPPEYAELIESKDDFKSKYDFVLGNYVASERFPAVQLRYLTGRRRPGVDLMDIERPEEDPEKIRTLIAYQKWLLSSQTVVPFYFTRTHIVYSKNIDIGNQPVTDADIQLWRMTRRAF